MEEAIKIWKEKNIVEGIMEFSCGGDSMNDTSFSYVTADNQTIYDSELDSYFDDAVYHHVDFYVNSDGHYMGEMGQVQILLEEGEEEFTYSKSATSEYCERVQSTLRIPLNETQANFIRENVRDINGDTWSVNFNYSRNFILDEEIENLQEEIGSLIENEVSSFVPDMEGELSDEASFETHDETFLNDRNELIIFVYNDVIVYEDSY